MLSKLAQFYRCTRGVPLQQLARRAELTLRRRASVSLLKPCFVPSAEAGPQPRPALPRRCFAPRNSLVVQRDGQFLLDQHGLQVPLQTPVDWQLENVPHTHLQRLTVHYHEFLESLPEEVAEPLVLDWIASNPPLQPRYWLDSWNSYAISIRCVCWMQWLAENGSTKSGEILKSIVQQIRFLVKNLETDIRGNHLIKNIRCLVWASAFFEGEEARRWKRLANRLLSKEIDRQFLADGMHYELSPAYHCQVVGDLLECACVLEGPERVELVARIQPMIDAMRYVTHPDGLISLFSDGGLHMVYSPGEIETLWDAVRNAEPGKEASQGEIDGGCGPINSDARSKSPLTPALSPMGSRLTPRTHGGEGAYMPLSLRESRALRPGEGTRANSPPQPPISPSSPFPLHSPPSALRSPLFAPSANNPQPPTSPSPRSPLRSLPSALRSSGYYRWTSERQWLLVDCGPVCEMSLPAHGHADMLAFEWDVDGQRFVVDNGVYQYEASRERLYDRSVASHNTLQIGEMDQAELIGSFRTGRRASARCESVCSGEQAFELVGAHDAYRFDGKQFTHRRRYYANASTLVIEDHVLGDMVSNSKPPINAVARFLFHDQCRFERLSETELRITRDQSTVILSSDLNLQIIPAEWSPNFGERVATHRVEARFPAVPGTLSFQFMLEP